tara:strand:- start:2803 stop:3021 length:219 start_codon:yes stop_codon:yes gene_type:complete
MNEEFIEEDIPFRIAVPTQEQIDKWQSQESTPYQTPPARDLVAEMWEKHNKAEEDRKEQELKLRVLNSKNRL